MGNTSIKKDPFCLQRFIDAQESIYPSVVRELKAGVKRGHWIWFVFPQVAGLGRSAMAEYYGIRSAAEARAFLAHSLLGVRLRECTRLMLNVEGRPLEQIFGYPDDLKFRSSMTLFAHIAEDNRLFVEALDKYCDGFSDPLTLARLDAFFCRQEL
jgi:uncharacterized protein (DUF1810 family)